MDSRVFLQIGIIVAATCLAHESNAQLHTELLDSYMNFTLKRPSINPITNFTALLSEIQILTLLINDKIYTFNEQCIESRDNFCAKDIGTCYCHHEFYFKVPNKNFIKEGDLECHLEGFPIADIGCYQSIYSYTTRLGCAAAAADSNTSCAQLIGFITCEVLNSRVLVSNATPNGSCYGHYNYIKAKDLENDGLLLSELISVSLTYDEEKKVIIWNSDTKWSISFDASKDFFQQYMINVLTEYCIYIFFVLLSLLVIAASVIFDWQNFN